MNIDTILTILVVLLIIFVPVVIYAIQRLGVGSGEIKIFDNIQQKSAELEADLIENLHKNKDNAECINDIKSKSVEIEKLLVDTAQLKFELIQKHNIDRIKLILTIFTVIVTLIAALSTYRNYLSMSDKDRKESLDKQFIDLSQKVASPNENEVEIAIITFPRFAIPHISKYQKAPEFKEYYNNYDDFLFDFTQKYPYVTESTTIILNVLGKKAVKRAMDSCKLHNPYSSCENLEEIYKYFKPPQFTGSVFSNTIINSLNSITNSTLQNKIVLKDEVNNPKYSFKRDKISAVDLRKKDFRGTYLRNADLEGINGEGVKFSFANLSGVDLDHSYLKDSELVDTVFRFASLKHCFLVDSLAKGADFTGANLEDSDFRNAILIEANFRDTYIASTKFNNAIIYKAKFLGKPFENNDKTIDELIEIESFQPIDRANFKNVKFSKDKNLPDFNDAIVDRENYDNLDFLNKNYKYKELTETDILKSDYVYTVEKYLINELKRNKKMGKLEKINKIYT